MVTVKPFAAVRPPKDIVTEVAAPPYDVLNSQEAKDMAGEKSLLHITKPEIDFDPILPDHDQRVYDRAVLNFKEWQKRGWLVQDGKPCYYVYSQTMDGRTQYGLVLCAHTDDYAEGRIKKNELTRKDKEDDRMIHVRIQNANIEPVFFAYREGFRKGFLQRPGARVRRTLVQRPPCVETLRRRCAAGPDRPAGGSAGCSSGCSAFSGACFHRSGPDHRRYADRHRDGRGRPSVLDLQPAYRGVATPPGELALCIMAGVPLNEADGPVEAHRPVQIIENLLITNSLKCSQPAILRQ